MGDKINYSVEIELFKSINELDEEVQKIMEIAQKARLKAHAPYSNFLVGAALLLENSQIIS